MTDHPDLASAARWEGGHWAVDDRGDLVYYNAAGIEIACADVLAVPGAPEHVAERAERDLRAALSTSLENASEESKPGGGDLESPGGQPTDDELIGSARYWHAVADRAGQELIAAIEKCERLEQELAKAKRWHESYRAVLAQSRTRDQTVARLERELAEFHAECDKVGIPHDAAALVRHHRGQGRVIGSADGEAQRLQLERELSEARSHGEVLATHTTSLQGVKGPPLAPGWSVINRAVPVPSGTDVQVVRAGQEATDG